MILRILFFLTQLNANQPVANYWIRAPPTDGTPEGLVDNSNMNANFTLAVLRYAGAPNAEPVGSTNSTATNLLVDKNLHRGKRDKTIDLKSLMARETMYRLPTSSMANTKHAKGKARASGQGPSFKLPSFPGNAHGEDVFAIADVPVPHKIVRKSAVKVLAARGMPKEHPEFEELFGWVIPGVGFSLRRKMNAVRVGNDEVEHLVDWHVLMYFDGFGGPVGRT
ncbi:hypothetical protein JB92DRAFT_2835480 [Gautieria morchelliformis]|nr:hypothetical protein JB92DRAFT_2835480 [Gautieria morchelliformis]